MYLFLSFVTITFGQKKHVRIAILGSSTAVGIGTTNIKNAWVNRLSSYLKNYNDSNEVINLAINGNTTYNIMPDGFIPAKNRPAPDYLHNISKALTFSPDAIIINLPTNDIIEGYSIEEQLDNYRYIHKFISKKNIPFWISTSQPRNVTESQRMSLSILHDSIINIFGFNSIDFWSKLADKNGKIKPEYDSGDGVHLNDSAHSIIFNGIIAKDIIGCINSPSDINIINIDLGGKKDEGVWNVLTLSTEGRRINDLLLTSGCYSGVSTVVKDGFTNINSAGTSIPDTLLSIPSTVSVDNFVGESFISEITKDNMDGFIVSGLEKDSNYYFSFFGSVMNNSSNLETRYCVVGSSKDTVYLDVSNNSNKIASTKAIKPSFDGTIRIEVDAGPMNNSVNGSYYLGAMKIVYNRNKLQGIDTSNNHIDNNKSIIVYPNPFDTNVSFELLLKENSIVYLTIYDTFGIKYYEKKYDFDYFGVHKIMWDGRNKMGLKIKKGVYLCNLLIKSVNGESTKTVKILYN